jgi:hypothetical protein
MARPEGKTRKELEAELKEIKAKLAKATEDGEYQYLTREEKRITKRLERTP